MNRVQKIILIGYIIIVFFLSLILVPFEGTLMGKNKYFYAPIWTTGKSLEQGPHRDYYTEEIEGITNWHLRVDMQRLVLELFAVSLVTGVIFVLVSKRTRKEKGVSQSF